MQEGKPAAITLKMSAMTEMSLAADSSKKKTSSTATAAEDKAKSKDKANLMDSVIQNFEESKSVDYSEPKPLSIFEKQARFGRKAPVYKTVGKNFRIKPLDSYSWYKKNYQADWFKNFKVLT